ncbi:methyl-accepting chemotaxis protein [Deferrisoma camini]|uniref:methyl-accepting chemotaxis protein n=1 Tax=Deferrisoma camini TaxID=1035120 RepID=UPI00046CD3A8|nr:methyl-accepting chemotaxis protein [Deferrisoma camini]
MKWRDIPVAGKFLLTFGLVIVLLAVPLFVCLSGMTTAKNDSVEGALVAEFAIDAGKAARSNLMLRRYEKDLLLNIGTREKQEKYLKKFEANLDLLSRLLGELEEHAAHPALGFTGEQRQLIATLRDNLSAYAKGAKSVAAEAMKGEISPQEANRLMARYKDATHRLGQELDRLAAFAERKLKEHSEEAISVSEKTRRTSLLLAVLAMVAALGTGAWMARWLASPIRRMGAVLDDIATGEGDLTKRLAVNGKDELNTMAGSVNRFMESMQQMIREVKESAEVLGRSSQGMSELAAQMSQGADEMFGRSNTVAAAAEEMSSNMANVAAAMEQATTNLGVISTAVEQMTSTIREIAQNTEKASTVTAQAVTVARSASERVGELGKAAQLIGKVTETINEISEQTKLLALNATIEAARAGEAGKGFAVVANEIKELARQTAEATGEIRERVEGIQGSTSATVTEIGEITRVIEEVNEIVTTIAAAVEEQSSTAREIADNVTQAAQGVEEVNTNVAQTAEVSRDVAREIADVNQAASEMSNSTSQVQAAAEDLSRLAGDLQALMARFKV